MSDKTPAIGPDEMAKMMGTEEVPGHPGFKWHSKIGQATPESEKEYRAGYYLAMQQLHDAIQRGGKFDRGYQHALVAIADAHERRGRLDAEDLQEWLRDTGARWLSDLPSDIQVIPPRIRLAEERR